MDSVETTEAHADAEAARAAAPQRQFEPPDRYHDVRPPLERLASGIGNRNMGQVVARMHEGGGILSGGLVHPDVQAAIAATRGGGRPLERSVASTLAPAMGALDDVRIHTGEGAAAMARAVSARAFTVGNDIYFGRGEYKPGTADGNELIAHEIAHTIQQRGAPAAGPLMVSQPGDALERDAEAAARDALG